METVIMTTPERQDLLQVDVAAEARQWLALALDSEDLAGALQLARRLHPWFSVAKVGLELFTAAGPDAVRALVDEGFSVFLDLKLHDIPTTVGGGATEARAIGATYLTAHTAGREPMMRAAVEGFGDGSGGILGVTVLTSQRDAPPELIAERARLAAATGCVGVVCAASDLGVAAACAPELIPVVPGIRLAGAASDDQARIATPAEAISAGARLLVIGRTVTAADDVEAAADEVAADVVKALNCQ
jgi:orotidine-5'-phosphate decarboxylase